MKNEKVLVSFSSGMDSTTLLYWAIQKYGKDNVSAVTFNYGSKHNDIEEKQSKFITNKLGIKHTVIKLDFSKWGFKSDLLKTGGEIPVGHYEQSNMSQTVVPNRNMIFLSILAGIADSNKIDKILLASHAGDHAIYKDCRYEFTQAVNLAIYLATDNCVKVESPFNNITKADILKIGLELNVPYVYTHTCYKGGVVPCVDELCGTCFERIEAFQINKTKDPLLTEGEWKKALSYVENHKNGL